MIEIMLVLALIGLIMGTVVVGLRRNMIKGQILITQTEIRKLDGMFLQHRLSNSGECPSIRAWVEDKTLDSEPKDPWGHSLSIGCPGEHTEGGADIASLGPDGKPGTKDDIESWNLH
jgi:general secretion pathway protein G